MKDEKGDWNLQGHPHRIVTISKYELKNIANVFDDPDIPEETKLPSIYAKELLDVINCFASQTKKVADYAGQAFMTQHLNETLSQDSGIIKLLPHFPEDLVDLIYCGPYISICNPFFKTPRRVCVEKSDYDRIDLSTIDRSYCQRSKYALSVPVSEYMSNSPLTQWGERYIGTYRIATRKMLGLNQERTLMAAVIPQSAAHINGIYGISMENKIDLCYLVALMSSLPYDFFVRSLGKSNFYDDTAQKLPMPDSKFQRELILRALLLNCLTTNYSALWADCFDIDYLLSSWSKQDERLQPQKFQALGGNWSAETPLRTDFERHQALVEIDVLVAMTLGMTLEQLKTVYKIQFPVFSSYESDTWYDSRGRIVFTNNKSLTSVGFDRPTWENGIKDAPTGQKFYRTITDDTMPGGPVERTIEYVAPFDRCDREQDYETAWRFFEEKYGK